MTYALKKSYEMPLNRNNNIENYKINKNNCNTYENGT